MQLALARDQHVPGFMLLATDHGVLAVRAEPTFGSGFSSGTGQVVVSASLAVLVTCPLELVIQPESSGC